MKYKTVLFDLDGTLIDTNELIITSFQHTLSSFFPERTFTREEIIPKMGETLVNIMAQYDESRVEEMCRVYKEFNIKTHDEMVAAFPHVVETVEQLHAAGVKLGIVTTKMRTTVEMGLRLCKLEPYFEAVVTLDDVEQAKPHPEPVLKAMAELGAMPESTLMIGDSSHDIEAGKRAGVDTAGVAWSLKGEEFLSTFSPTYILRDMRELLEIVRVAE